MQETELAKLCREVPTESNLANANQRNQPFLRRMLSAQPRNRDRAFSRAFAFSPSRAAPPPRGGGDYGLAVFVLPPISDVRRHRRRSGRSPLLRRLQAREGGREKGFLGGEGAEWRDISWRVAMAEKGGSGLIPDGISIASTHTPRVKSLWCSRPPWSGPSRLERGVRQ